MRLLDIVTIAIQNLPETYREEIPIFHEIFEDLKDQFIIMNPLIVIRKFLLHEKIIQQNELRDSIFQTLTQDVHLMELFRLYLFKFVEKHLGSKLLDILPFLVLKLPDSYRNNWGARPGITFDEESSKSDTIDVILDRTLKLLHSQDLDSASTGHADYRKRLRRYHENRAFWFADIPVQPKECSNGSSILRGQPLPSTSIPIPFFSDCESLSSVEDSVSCD